MIFLCNSIKQVNNHSQAFTLHFNSHFPAEPGLAAVTPWIIREDVGWVFHRQGALPLTQPTLSKHWSINRRKYLQLRGRPACCQSTTYKMTVVVAVVQLLLPPRGLHRDGDGGSHRIHGNGYNCCGNTTGWNLLLQEIRVVGLDKKAVLLQRRPRDAPYIYTVPQN